MKIKVLEKTPGCLPEIIEGGDWIDLRTAQEITLKAPYSVTKRKRVMNNGDVRESQRKVVFHSTLIPLGICIEVPKGCESILVPRSSTFEKYGILQANSEGVIDFLYHGDEDEWKMPVLATREVTIPKGTRIAQFRVQLSQKATWWQKLKWLFDSSVKIEQVDSLGNPSRDGFGSTGTN